MQHTHIVPIYSVHKDAGAGVRAVCMPYFGGASLSAVLKSLRTGNATPTRGAELANALTEAEAETASKFAPPTGTQPFDRPFAPGGEAEQVVECLRRAFAEGYGREKVGTDPDLAAIRQHPRFVQLLAEIGGSR
jgi:hypothetical protein